MTAISVGGLNLNNNLYSRKTILHPTQADGTGKIDSITVGGYNYNGGPTGVKAGTFYGSAGTYKMRDYVLLGDVGIAEVTFTGLDVDVVLDDFIGQWGTSQYFGAYFGYSAYTWNVDGVDCFDGADHEFAWTGYTYPHLLGTGVTGGGGWANIAKAKGIASADIAKFKGIAVADMAKVNGVAV